MYRTPAGFGGQLPGGEHRREPRLRLAPALWQATARYPSVVDPQGLLAWKGLDGFLLQARRPASDETLSYAVGKKKF